MLRLPINHSGCGQFGVIFSNEYGYYLCVICLNKVLRKGVGDIGMFGLAIPR